MTASSMIATSVARLSLCLAPLFLLACDDAEAPASDPVRADAEPTGLDVTAPPATPRAAQSAAELEIDYPGALCNDGNKPVVHVELDPNGGNNWLVYLQGGGSCNSEDSCKERWTDCSGGPDDVIGWHGNMVPDVINPSDPPDFEGMGILDFDGHGGKPSPFAGKGFNRVFVPYCSSDHWRGLGNTQSINLAASCGDDALTELYFGGGKIVEGVIDEIMNSQEAPGAGNFIVLAGGSAGGEGVQQNLESVATQAQSIEPGITVVGVADASFRVGLSQTSPPSSASVVSELFWAADTTHAAGDPIDVVVNDGCWTAETGAAKDHCHNTAYMVPTYMQQPLLLTTNSYDNTGHGAILNDKTAYLISQCDVTIEDTNGADPDQDAFYDAYCVPTPRADDLREDFQTWMRYQLAIDGAAILDTTTNISYYITHSNLGLHDQLLKTSDQFYRPATTWEPYNVLGDYEFAGLGGWTSTSGDNVDPSIATTVGCALGLVGLAGAPSCDLADVRVTSDLPTNVAVIENYLN
jgi:hypothetical protein